MNFTYRPYYIYLPDGTKAWGMTAVQNIDIFMGGPVQMFYVLPNSPRGYGIGMAKYC